ncbi:MAG: hypothetical protein ACFFDY_01275 [Candidatus Thorarchaeota archaeon]
MSSSSPFINHAMLVPESESPAVIVILAESIVAELGIFIFSNLHPHDQIQSPAPSRPISSIESVLLNVTSVELNTQSSLLESG